MIKINLLPFRAARKKENVKRQISIYILSIVLLGCLMALAFAHLNESLKEVRKEKANVLKELAKYRDTNKELAAIKKKIREIKSKLLVIENLQTGLMAPVQLLDEIAMAVPKDKLWLRSLKETRGKLNLDGTAMDNETVALFMSNLEKARHIKKVDLRSTRLKVLKKYKLSLMDFSIECRTDLFDRKRGPRTKRRVKVSKKKRKK